MEDKILNINNVKKAVGWAYPDFKWLTPKEAVRINRERDRLLRLLSGKVHFHCLGSKIYTGRLSPGCITCGEGTWSCMFINGLCTAHCFYCPQDRKMKKERLPSAQEGIIFRKPGDYADFLEKLGFKGAGFSGGEPFLIFEKLLKFIRQIRRRFKDGIYLWIYTNGDLVTPDKVKRLKSAGLNEIRFNISAREYGLRKVEMAVGNIDTVTVEIPAIPEDFEIVKKSLSRMQDIGVKHLNLHQLTATNLNYKDYIKRNYTFLHHPSVPIAESELTALKLFQYALAKKITLPLNYCSASYKGRFQGKGSRMRTAPFAREGFEEITPAGYIRSFSFGGSPLGLKHLDSFSKREASHAGPRFTIRYFEPRLTGGKPTSGSDKEIILNSLRKLYAQKAPVFEQEGVSLFTIKCIVKLYIEHMEWKDVLSYFYQNYPLTKKESVERVKEEIKLLVSIKKWEELESGFPPMY